MAATRGWSPGDAAVATLSPQTARCPSVFAHPSTLQHNIFAPGSHLQIRTRAEEGVAPDLLAALDGFKQESIRLQGSNREKGRHRSQQIGGDRLDYGHQREVAGEARKFLVIGA